MPELTATAAGGAAVVVHETPATAAALQETVDTFAASFARGSGGQLPRPQQSDCVRSVCSALRSDCGGATPSNYLIQHATGSGKTHTIASLAHALCSLDDVRSNRFALVLIVTDRKVLDEQVGDVVERYFEAHDSSALVERATSCDNLRALLRRKAPRRGRTRVVITTFQKASGRAAGGEEDGEGAMAEGSASESDEASEEAATARGEGEAATARGAGEAAALSAARLVGGRGMSSEEADEGAIRSNQGQSGASRSSQEQSGSSVEAAQAGGGGACLEPRVVILADEAHRSHGHNTTQHLHHLVCGGAEQPRHLSCAL